MIAIKSDGPKFIPWIEMGCLKPGDLILREGGDVYLFCGNGYAALGNAVWYPGPSWSPCHCRWLKVQGELVLKGESK